MCFHGFECLRWLWLVSTPSFGLSQLTIIGEGFAGKSFGGLEDEKPPQLLLDIDTVFPGLWVWWTFPVLSRALMYSPIMSVKHFLTAPGRFKEVSFHLVFMTRR
jgi:hypothetical protein